MLGIKVIKGDPGHLTGRLLAYAKLEGEPMDSEGAHLSAMARNGILAVSGDFANQHSLRDFFRKEFDSSVEEGLSGLVERLKDSGEIPADLQGEELRKKLDGFGSMEIIPVPAKVVFLEDEAEALGYDADVFFLGTFRSHPGAHLAVTSFPILYQSVYREQCARELGSEISELLGEIEAMPAIAAPPRPDNDPAVLHFDGDLSSFRGNLRQLLTESVVPNLVYNLGSPVEYRQSIANFRRFMRPFRWPDEIARFERLVLALKGGEDPSVRIKLDRHCNRISALFHEEFEELRKLDGD